MNNGGDLGFLEGNGIIIILLFFVFFMFGNNGFNGSGNGGFQNAIENQNLMNKLDTMSTGLGQATWNINNEIMKAESQLQNCCCQTQKEIIESRYASERNSNNIVNAIHNDGEATRRLINESLTQNLRDQLDQARDVISNVNQSRYILDSLGRYVTNMPCPPYNPCGSPCGNLY